RAPFGHYAGGEVGEPGPVALVADGAGAEPHLDIDDCVLVSRKLEQAEARGEPLDVGRDGWALLGLGRRGRGGSRAGGSYRRLVRLAARRHDAAVGCSGL